MSARIVWDLLPVLAEKASGGRDGIPLPTITSDYDGNSLCITHMGNSSGFLVINV